MNVLWFIVITYNSGKTISKTLSSIVETIIYEGNGNFPLNKIGVLISDDCSTDNTILQIENFIDEIKIKHKFINFELKKNAENKGTVKNIYGAYTYIKNKLNISDKVYVKAMAGDDCLIPKNFWLAYKELVVKNLDVQFNSVLVNTNKGFNKLLASIPDNLSRTSIGKILIARHHYIMTPGTIINLDYAIKYKKVAIENNLILLDDWMDSILVIDDKQCIYSISNIPVVKYYLHNNSVMRTKSERIRKLLSSDLIIQKNINSDIELKIINENYIILIAKKTKIFNIILMAILTIFKIYIFIYSKFLYYKYFNRH